MANLQTGGIELIVKGFSAFMRSMGQVNKSYDTMNKASTNASKAVVNAAQKVARAQDRVKIAENNVEKAVIASEKAWRKLISTQETLSKGKAAGVLDPDDITRLENKVLSLSESWQTLSLSAVNSMTRLGSAQANLVVAQNAHSEAMAAAAATGINLGAVLKVLGVVVAALGIAVLAGVAAWNVFKKVVSAVASVVSKVIDIFQSAARAVGNFVSRVASIVAGLTIYSWFRKVGEAVKNLSDEVMEAISFFQKLRIQLESLQARDIAQETGKTIAASFGEATERAKELYTWIANLAVRTPFTARGISETLAMANAMGLNIGMAKQMTKATIDFTSAMGLSEDHMFRIIYNFGQMLAQGKLNGREFRDLANSFVPVWRMLENMAKGTGKTTEEFKKLAFEGKVPVEAFFKEFIRMAEEDFAGAATKMARTLEGVTNNLRDFLQLIIGASALGPTFDFIAERLAKALDSLLRPGVRKSAEEFGQALLQAFKIVRSGVDILFQALGNLARAFGLPTMSANKFAKAITFVAILIRRGLNAITAKVMEMTNGLNTTFSQSAAKAQAWGYNFVAQFAKGMATAVNLIVQVINTITRILSSWFKTSSPPKVAPDIDKWGAATMTEWMKGWLNFDFSVFNDIAAKVEGFLRSIPGGIGKDNTGLVPAILGGREVITKAINNVRNGMMTVSEAANMVFSKVKKLTSEFKAYIVALFDVEAINKKVAASEQAIADAQAEVDKINQKITAAQAEQTAITEKYDAVLKDLNKQLEQATEIYDEQHRIREIDNSLNKGRLTDAERERLEMEKRQLLIKQQIRDTEDQRDTEVGVVQQKIDSLEAEKALIEQKVAAAEAAKSAAQAELDAAQDRLAAAEALIDIQIEQNQLIQEQMDLLESLKKAAGAGGAGGAVEDLSEFFDDLGLSVDDATDAIAEYDIEILRVQRFNKEHGLDILFQQMTSAVDNFLKTAGGFGTALSPMTTALGNLSTALSGLVGIFPHKGAMDDILPLKASTPMEKLALAVERIGNAFNTVSKTGAGSAFVTLVEILGKAIANVDWVKIGDGISNLIMFFAAGVIIIEKFVADMWMWYLTFKFVKDELVKMVEEAKTKIKEKLDETVINFILFGLSVTGALLGLKKDVVDQSIIPEMMQAIYDSVTTKLTEIQTWLDQTWIVNMIKSFTGYKKDVSDEGGLIPTSMKDIYDSVTTKLGEAYTEWSTGEKSWSSFVTILDDKFNLKGGIIDIVDVGLNAVANFFKPAGVLWVAIDGFINGAIANLKAAIQGAIDLWNTLRGKSTSTDTGTGTGTGTGQGGTGRTTGPATGGIVKRGFAYDIAEKGREMIIPLMNSLVVPNWLTEQMLAPQMAGVTNITNITNVEVNPTYRNVQSEASLYYDISAALSAARL